MKLTLYMILMIAFASCIIIPVPHHTKGGRIAIDSTIYSFIQPNHTSREDILLHIGDPDGVAMEKNVFIYHWTTVTGWAAVSGGGGVAATGDITREEFFLVGFNNDNTVKKFEHFKYNITRHKTNMYQFIKDWFEK